MEYYCTALSPVLIYFAYHTLLDENKPESKLKPKIFTEPLQF